jgi:hypothetical protein
MEIYRNQNFPVEHRIFGRISGGRANGWEGNSPDIPVLGSSLRLKPAQVFK